MNHTTTSSSASSTFPHTTGPVPTVCNDTSPACYPNDGNESLTATATLGGGEVVFDGDVCNDLSPSCYPNDGNESGLAGGLEWAALGGGEVVFDGDVCNDISPSCYPNDGNESGLAGDLGASAARAAAK